MESTFSRDIEADFQENRTVGAQICNTVETMLERTWTSRMIESGSNHFLLSLAEINLAGAQIEIGEAINDFKEASTHARSSLTNLKQTLAIYKSLVEGVSKLLTPTQQSIQAASEFNYESFHTSMVEDGLIPDESRLWNELKAELSKEDGISGVKLFISKCEEIEKPLEELVQRMDANRTDEESMKLAHKINTKFYAAATIGKLLALYNSQTRPR